MERIRVSFILFTSDGDLCIGLIKEKNSQNHENLKHSIAGAGAGIVSSIVTCPLDVAKTRLQNQGVPLPGERLYSGTVGTLSRIWTEEGIRGLYRGLGPTILGYLPTWAIYFTAYDYCKSHWADELGILLYIFFTRHVTNTYIHTSLGHDKEWLLHISSAMSAGVASSVLTNPLWVIKTRLMVNLLSYRRFFLECTNIIYIYIQTQNERTAYRYNNTLHAFITIAKEEGFRGYYKGLGPSLIGISHVAVQFPLYERLKVVFRKCYKCKIPLTHKKKQLTFSLKKDVDRDIVSGSSSILLASSLSKMAASLATYPHEVIRTRLQNQTRKPYKYQGIVHAIKIISKEEGIRGFYKGLSTNLVRTVPSSAMTILTYELVVKKLDDWKNL